MAWNEPGNHDKNDKDDKRKDPWNQGGDNGPPDLDEVMQQLQQKFRQWFGASPRKTPNSGNGGGFIENGPSMAALTTLFVMLLLIWFFSGIYIIEEGKRGLVLRFGKYHKTEFPGLNWRPRFIDSILTVDISKQRIVEIGYRMGEGGQINAVHQEALMLTEDENIVNIRLAVQYQVTDPIKYSFKITHPDNALKQAAESALREVVGRHSMDFILTKGRTQLVQQIQPLMQEILNQYDTGLTVTTVNLQDAQPPEEVQEAFADVIKAREDKQRLKNEADAYAKDIIPKARGAAARQLQEADAYKSQVISAADGEATRFNQVLTAYTMAPAITQERLYLETIEQVLQKTTKIIVDLEQNNNLLYLPLDKLLAAPPSTEATEMPKAPTSLTLYPTPAQNPAESTAAEQKPLPREPRTRGNR